MLSSSCSAFGNRTAARLVSEATPFETIGQIVGGSHFSAACPSTPVPSADGRGPAISRRPPPIRQTGREFQRADGCRSG